MPHTSGNPRIVPLTLATVRESYIEAGMSRRQFALSIGMPEPTLRRFESGRGIHPSNAKVLADHFGVKVADVLALSERADAA